MKLSLRLAALAWSRRLLLGALAVAAAGCGPVAAAPLTSIQQITAGVTVDFENPGDSMADQFSAHDLTASYSPSNNTIGAFTPWITGNTSAPASGGNLHGSFRVEANDRPWSHIGASGLVGLFALTVDQPSADLTITAFDQNNLPLGSFTRTFHATPQSSALAVLQQAYNDAVVFVGISLDEPIYAVEFTASSATPQVAANINWDNLRFTVVPEPSAYALSALALVGLGTFRGRVVSRRKEF